MRLPVFHKLKRLMLIGLIAALTGCQNPKAYRREADQVALDIIQAKQVSALNSTEPFTIERPRDRLRRRLILDQDLPYAGAESLGPDKLHPLDHWPEEDYPSPTIGSPLDFPC
jgi:hypothetical protein